MKRKLGSIAAIAALSAAAVVGPAAPASAQTAYNTSFQTAITYQNVDTSSDTAAASIDFQFYPENSATPIRISRTLAKGAGASLFVGSLGTELAGFNGSGSVVVSSTKPIVATTVQVPASTSPVKNRPLSNGFSNGSTKQLIATVLKEKFNSTTKFSVQNASSGNVSGTVKFFNAEAGGAEITAARQTITNLPPGAARSFDAGKIAGLPTPFNGSATIEMNGEVVATALELSTNGTGASAFEGVQAGSTTVYMPSAMCNVFGGQGTSYAVQNTSATATAQVTVNYSNGVTHSQAVGPGAKQSFVACQAPGMPQGFSGSATITSTGGEVVAVAKIFGAGRSTAALGATSGAAKLALPYVRWSQTQFETGQRQRAYIAIQNVGPDIAAGQVTVRYIDKNGNTVGSPHVLGVIPRGAKVNSNPTAAGPAANEFGYYTDGTFGGSAIIQGPAGSQLTAVVRVETKSGTTTFAEDYNGIPVD